MDRQQDGRKGRPALGPAYGSGAPLPRLTEAQRTARAAILAADDEHDYESVACLCGSTGSDGVLNEVDRHGLPARYVICEACGLRSALASVAGGALPPILHHRVPVVVQSVDLAETRIRARNRRGAPATRERVEWITTVWRQRSGKASARIVEIGAGGGWNLAGLPRDRERIGYDLDDAYLTVGREAFGLDMRRGLALDALPELANADIILLSHVVEHLADPSETLRAIGKAMRSDALALIEVPGIFRIHRSNLDPRSYLQNAHTFTFCAPTLRDVCERAGLEVLEVDETARATCRPGLERSVSRPATHPGLAKRIVRYLRSCDFGYRQYRRMGSLPLVGRLLAYGWRRTWFALVGTISYRDDREA